MPVDTPLTPHDSLAVATIRRGMCRRSAPLPPHKLDPPIGGERVAIAEVTAVETVEVIAVVIAVVTVVVMTVVVTSGLHTIGKILDGPVAMVEVEVIIVETKFCHYYLQLKLTLIINSKFQKNIYRALTFIF